MQIHGIHNNLVSTHLSGDTHGEKKRGGAGSTRTVRGNCRHCDACRGVFYPLVPPPEAAGGPWGRGRLCWWRRRHAHARNRACQQPSTVSMAIGARVLLVRAPVHARTLQRAVATGFRFQSRNNRENNGERERNSCPKHPAIEIDPPPNRRVRDHRLYSEVTLVRGGGWWIGDRVAGRLDSRGESLNWFGVRGWVYLFAWVLI